MTLDYQRAYDPHQVLLTEARKRPELWRLIVGMVIVAAVVLILNTILFTMIANLGSTKWARDFLSGTSPEALLVILASFIFAILGVALAARWAQRRSLATVIGPQTVAIRQFWRVLRALVLLGVVLLILPPYDLGAPLVANLPLSKWLILLPLSVIAVLIQTSAEEILFRGYLQQGLAARFQSPLIWMVLPSILFAVGHYSPSTAGDNALLIAIWALAFGVLAADLTARSGTLGPAIALHFFNNFAALLVISLPDSLSGLALYHLPYEVSDTQAIRPWLLVDFGLMIVGWLAARLALRR